MRILVFSDTHLTHRFQPKKYAFLVKIIRSCDQVIVNGDFWDSYFTSFDRFVTSNWKKLFPLLLSKNTIYLYGNHDPQTKSDSRVLLFSKTQRQDIDLSIDGNKYHIEHGNRILISTKSFDRMPILLKKVWIYIISTVEYLLSHFIPFISDPLKKIGNINGIHRKNKETFLICGHSHAAQIHTKSKYINSGYVKYGVGSYIIIENGRLSLHKEVYGGPRLTLQKPRKPLSLSI